MNKYGVETSPLETQAVERLHIRDWALMLGIMMAYAVVAFIRLGDVQAPQTAWQSTRAQETVTFDLGAEHTFRLCYYPGIQETSDSVISVELSNDQETWTTEYYTVFAYSDMFKWQWFRPCNEAGELLYVQGNDHQYEGVTFCSDENMQPLQTARFVRLGTIAPFFSLYEVGFLDENGTVIPVTGVVSAGGDGSYTCDPALLIDEQALIPSTPSMSNSMYFDEVYFARTGYELLHGMRVYEWTHPPLGKALLSVGIRLFGMTPFGWRFMGTLAGVLMLPAMFFLALRLTKRVRWALLAEALLALDCMHFVQTRIATVDSHCVLFIMMMYLFMVLYMQTDWKTGFRKGLIYLVLSGLFLGLACATKWIGVYGAVGLAVLFFLSFFKRVRAAWKRPDEGLAYRVTGTLTVCVFSFILVPLVVYYASYASQMAYTGGATIAKVADLQKVMLSYHTDLSGSTHPYVAKWYTWPVLGWPMWYYTGNAYQATGWVSSIACIGNIVIFWTGLVAMLMTLIRVCWKRTASLAGIVVITGYFSCYLPWVLVQRTTYIYHYFASVPFLMLAIAVVLNDWLGEQRSKKTTIVIYTLLLSAGICFALYYPLLSGLAVPRWYVDALNLFHWKIY